MRRRHEAHMRVLNVCAEHSALFDATPGGQKTRTALGKSVTDVDRFFALQAQALTDRSAAVAEIRLARARLRGDAKAVLSVGKAMAEDVADVRTMQLPRFASDDALLAYSRALLDRVTRHADAFVADGLPPDALTQFEGNIATFAAARDAQAAARQRFSAAYASIREALTASDKSVGVVMTIALKTPAANPEVVAKLRMARRVGPRVSAPAPTSPPATSTDKAA
jgi:hypothetical protein